MYRFPKNSPEKDAVKYTILALLILAVVWVALWLIFSTTIANIVLALVGISATIILVYVFLKAAFETVDEMDNNHPGSSGFN